MDKIPMIPITRDQKIKLLLCMSENRFDPGIFPELYNYICPKPISKAEAKKRIKALMEED